MISNTVEMIDEVQRIDEEMGALVPGSFVARLVREVATTKQEALLLWLGFRLQGRPVFPVNKEQPFGVSKKTLENLEVQGHRWRWTPDYYHANREKLFLLNSIMRTRLKQLGFKIRVQGVGWTEFYR